MPRNEHHVVSRGGNGWAVIKNNSNRASGLYNTKQEAINAGRQISINQNTELVIHNRDGKISGSDSHGNVPCPPKDRT